MGHLDEAAADVDAVQGALEERPEFVLEGEQGAGLRERGVVRAVGQPLGLLQEAGPEEVPGVAVEGVRAGQPALVAAQAVGVGAQQQVPGGVGALGEPGVGQGPFGEPQDGGAAHGFVGVRSGDHQGVPTAVADGEQQQRGARAGGADAAQPGVPGVAGGECGRPGAQLVHGRVAQEGRQGTPPRCGPSVHLACAVYAQSVTSCGVRQHHEKQGICPAGTVPPAGSTPSEAQARAAEPAPRPRAVRVTARGTARLADQFAARLGISSPISSTRGGRPSARSRSGRPRGPRPRR